MVPVSILWFRLPFCGSGFHFVVPASILWFRLPFCGSGFHFADLASLLQVCLRFCDVLLDLDRLLASQETCALVAIGQGKQGSARVFCVYLYTME